MKKILALFLAIIMALTVTTQFEKVQVFAKQSPSKVKFVKLSKDYKLTVKFISNRKKGAEIGHGFILQRKVNGKWITLTCKEDVGINSDAIVIKGKGSLKKTYNLGFYYYEDEFVPGSYRVITDVNFKNKVVKFKIKRKAPTSGEYYGKSKVSLKSIKNNVVTVRFCNGSKKHKIFGRPWRLYRKENEKWTELDNGGIAFTAEACNLPGKSYTDYSYNLLSIYKKEQLISGTYKIETDYGIKKNEIEFEIK